MGWAPEVLPTNRVIIPNSDWLPSQPTNRGVHVQEIDGDDPGGLSCQELTPARARPARRRIDARSPQDLPYGGRRDCHAELGQFAVDPAVSPQRILLRPANDQAGDAG